VRVLPFGSLALCRRHSGALLRLRDRRKVRVDGVYAEHARWRLVTRCTRRCADDGRINVKMDERLRESPAT
jgi:hypothetical protein